MTFEIKKKQHKTCDSDHHANPPPHKCHLIKRKSSAKRKLTGDTAHFIEKRVFSKRYTREGKTFIKAKTRTLIYTKLISTKCTHPSHNQQKWLKDCQLDDVDSINWRDAYQLASKYTKSTRILEFQFKFLHRRIATNDFLTKIGVRDNPNCSFCNGEQEKLFHLFWSCPKVASFWHDLTVRLTFLHITPEHYIMDPLVALGLKPDSSKNYQQINFSCLLARNYIWMSKRKETAPKVEGFLQYLKSIYNMEANAECAHSKKWEFLNTFC